MIIIEEKNVQQSPITTLTVVLKGHLCTLGQVIKPITQLNPLLISNFHLEACVYSCTYFSHPLYSFFFFLSYSLEYTKREREDSFFRLLCLFKTAVAIEEEEEEDDEGRETLVRSNSKSGSMDVSLLNLGNSQYE